MRQTLHATTDQAKCAKDQSKSNGARQGPVRVDNEARALKSERVQWRTSEGGCQSFRSERNQCARTCWGTGGGKPYHGVLSSCGRQLESRHAAVQAVATTQCGRSTRLLHRG